MEREFENKVAVITGGAKGIGDDCIATAPLRFRDNISIKLLSTLNPFSPNRLHSILETSP